jgi:hypothetical protein
MRATPRASLLHPRSSVTGPSRRHTARRLHVTAAATPTGDEGAATAAAAALDNDNEAEELRRLQKGDAFAELVRLAKEGGVDIPPPLNAAAAMCGPMTVIDEAPTESIPGRAVTPGCQIGYMEHTGLAVSSTGVLTAK